MNHYILNPEIKQLAVDAIKSFRQTGDVYIISVDDASPMDTTDIEVLSDVFIRRKTNGGFAVSANDGLKSVKEDAYIVYANNDIKVFPGWQEKMIQVMNEFNADMVGGLGFREDIGKEQWNDVSEGGQYRDWMFPGGFFFTTTQFFRDVGFYDENYRHGGVEDIDLFWRAKQLGKRLIMTPEVKYWHKEGATRYSATQKDIQSKAIKENEAYFERKFGFDPIKHLGKILIDNRINR